MAQLDFDIRYVIMNPHEIFNECGPENTGPWQWTPHDIMTRKANAEKTIHQRNKRDKFYTLLEKSILQEGFRNPILVCAGWCPPKKYKKLPPTMKNNKNKILICDRHGGSRLWIAQKHDLDIPCIISDFCGRFNDQALCENQNDVLKYFQDQPDRLVINAHGVHVRKLPQIQFNLKDK